jgi:hypothetical protein
VRTYWINRFLLGSPYELWPVVGIPAGRDDTDAAAIRCEGYADVTMKVVF